MAIDAQSVSLVGHDSEVLIVDRTGVKKFNPLPSVREDEMNGLIRDLNRESTGNFGELWSSLLMDSIAKNKELYAAFATTLSTNVFPVTSIGMQLESITKLMKMEGRNSDRDFFFVTMGGYDTHSQVTPNLDAQFKMFDDALAPFVKELKAHGLWDSTVLVETSEFARTLNPNSGDGQKAVPKYLDNK